MSKIIIFTIFEKKSLLFFISSIFSAEMFTKFSFPEMKSNLPWGLFLNCSSVLEKTSSLKGGNSVPVINGFNKFEFEIVISLLHYRVILEHVVHNIMGKEYQKSLISIGTNI
ncbi:hypothetical protein ESCOCK401M_22125 [Escherichia coli]|nr:hypothetical protein ExPUPEC87_02948 [Escherichia coli]